MVFAMPTEDRERGLRVCEKDLSPAMGSPLGLNILKVI
jgi:hypothetical protein